VHCCLMGRPFGAADIVVQRQIENQDKLLVFAIGGRDGKIAATATARAG
jgi:hypothetical protein